jgi:hypothetical protein
VTGPRRAVLAAAALVLAAVLAGCDTIPGTGGGTAEMSTCAYGATGYDVQVQVTNSSCSRVVQALASFGLNWYVLYRLSDPGTPGEADGETMGVTCSLAKGASVMTVEDAGGMIYGNQICSSEEQDGWAPVPP